ncbi:MAG: protein kinase domain-containing protein, partial [bacterium]
MPAEAPLILVVDDYADNRELFCRRLERDGFRVESAESGKDAIARIDRGGLSLVLLDIMMPEMSGLDVLRYVRFRHSALELPVIMVTAKTESADVVEALGLGANDYVMKPLDFNVVLARMQTQLKLQSAAFAPAQESAPREGETGVGSVLDGRYRLEACIGSGNFGTVYRARHVELDHNVAVKLLNAGAVGPEALARFRREGESACRVRHPNAVAVLDFGVTDGTAYLVMELLSGYPLEEELRGGRALPVARSVRIVAAVAQALAEAHRAGIVHRDIKPANIFVTRRGQAKVLDFGLAKLAVSKSRDHAADDSTRVVEDRVTTVGTTLGTIAYMSPEQARGSDIDGRSDLFSFGVVLYEMGTGTLPFPGKTPVALFEELLTRNPPPPSSGKAGLPAEFD